MTVEISQKNIKEKHMPLHTWCSFTALLILFHLKKIHIDHRIVSQLCKKVPSVDSIHWNHLIDSCIHVNWVRFLFGLSHFFVASHTDFILPFYLSIYSFHKHYNKVHNTTQANIYAVNFQFTLFLILTWFELKLSLPSCIHE